ncbi:MAG: VWA domain-containing protein [Candidatus Hodarchaeales archaeon]|jgi:uncharacterized protein YegL
MNQLIKRKLKKWAVISLMLIFFTQIVSISIGDAKIEDDYFLGVIFESYSIETEIYETFSQTNVTHVYRNPTDDATRGNFNVKIPENAYLTNATMKIGNYTFWGRILEVQEAQQSFENASEAGESAVLLTQLDSSEYIVDFSISNQTKVLISLSYVERLVRILGRYELVSYFEESPAGPPNNWMYKTEIFSPKRLIADVQAPEFNTINFPSSREAVVTRSGSGNVPSEAITVYYSLHGESFGSNIITYSNGTKEFFVATFSPILEDLGSEQVGKDFVFLIDVSGSMGIEKMDQAKEALKDIINNLYIEDRFGIVKFSSEATVAQSSLANRSDNYAVANLQSWVDGLSSSGSTNIYGALSEGLDLFESNSRPKVMVLLTDGNPTTNVTNFGTIEELFTTNNREIGVSLFALGFGDDVEFTFLQSISRSNNGDAVKILTTADATEQITSFYNMISTPVIVDLTVNSVSGVNGNLYPYFLPSLYEGSELMLVGERSGDINITIMGRTSEGEASWYLLFSEPSNNSSENKWVEQLYALAIIDDLLTQITYLSEDTSELKAIVLNLSLYYGIVTPYTAIFIDTTILEIPEPMDIEVEGYVPDSMTTVNTWNQGPPDTSPSDIRSPSAAFTKAEDGAAASIGIISILLSLLPLIGINLINRWKK